MKITIRNLKRVHLQIPTLEFDIGIFRMVLECEHFKCGGWFQWITRVENPIFVALLHSEKLHSLVWQRFKLHLFSSISSFFPKMRQRLWDRSSVEKPVTSKFTFCRTGYREPGNTMVKGPWEFMIQPCCIQREGRPVWSQCQVVKKDWGQMIGSLLNIAHHSPW